MTSEFEDEFIEPERHPLDAEALEKGDYISPERCEKITGKQKGTDKFQLALLNLRDWIEKERRELGDPIHLSIVKGGLHVLTDEEDVEYRERQEKRGVRAIGSALMKSREIDVMKLSDGARAKLDRQQCRLALRISSMRTAMRKELPPPSEEEAEQED